MLNPELKSHLDELQRVAGRAIQALLEQMQQMDDRLRQTERWIDQEDTVRMERSETQ